MSRSQPGDSVGIAGSGRTVRLGRMIGAGATAQVFEVEDDPNVVAKMYLGTFPEQLERLRPHFRRVFRDADGAAIREGAICAYPIVHVTRDKDPAGFLMRRFAIGGPDATFVTLEELVNSAASSDPEACLLVARRLARDVEFFHERGLVVGDMSLRNILIKTTDGQVAWVDLDSFGAEERDGVPAVHTYARTVRFFPPELNRAGVPSNEVSDRFALGMHVLTLLTLQALHPYAIDRVDGEPLTDDARIEQGLSWMVEPSRYATARVNHAGLAAWPAELAALARALLVDGTTDPDARPTARAWREVLASVTPEQLTAAAQPARPRPVRERPVGSGTSGEGPFGEGPFAEERGRENATGESPSSFPPRPSTAPSPAPSRDPWATPTGTWRRPASVPSSGPPPFSLNTLPRPPAPAPQPGKAAKTLRSLAVAVAVGLLVLFGVRALSHLAADDNSSDTGSGTGSDTSYSASATPSATDSSSSSASASASSAAASRSPSPSRTPTDVIDTTDEGDCLDNTRLFSGGWPSSTSIVSCGSSLAAARVIDVVSPTNADQCDTDEGYFRWNGDDWTYCLERVFQVGQCSPAELEDGDVGIYSSIVVSCDSTARPSGVNRIVRIVQVLDGSSRSCSSNSLLRYTYTTRGLTVCAEVHRVL